MNKLIKRRSKNLIRKGNYQRRRRKVFHILGTIQPKRYQFFLKYQNFF